MIQNQIYAERCYLSQREPLVSAVLIGTNIILIWELLNMKLQRFIENHQRDSTSPVNLPFLDNSHIFKTSESIGTLNSHDQFATDRSFVIKQSIPIQYEFSQHKKQTSIEVEHLKELCNSERPTQILHKYIEMETSSSKQQEKTQQQPDKYRIKSTKQFPFRKIKEELDYALPCFSGTFNGQTSLLMAPSLKFNQTQEQFESNDLYEEAPSHVSRVDSPLPTESQSRTTLNKMMNSFMIQFDSLLERVKGLQEQNIKLEEEWLQQEKLALQFQQMQNQLERQVQCLKGTVKSVIQENIEIENMIKELLLKQEIQKYRYISKEDKMAELLTLAEGRHESKVARTLYAPDTS